MTDRSTKKMSPRTPKQYEEIRDEKRNLIMDVALEHFASDGYHNTTISQIARYAGISKGLLFHYFRNKQELYNYLENFVFQKMMDVILEEIDWNESDIFNRIKQIAIIKMEVISKYPGIETFGKVIYEKNN